jgi:hypothetical protein
MENAHRALTAIADKARPNSGARVIACTPGVSGISPTGLPGIGVDHNDMLERERYK